MGTDTPVSGWFRIEVPCLDISLRVSFQDSQDEQKMQGRRGTEYSPGASGLAVQTRDRITALVVRSTHLDFIPSKQHTGLGLADLCLLVAFR